MISHNGNFEKKLQELVNQQGLTLFGITSPENISSYSKFIRWLEQNNFGQMEFLSKPTSVIARQNPRNLLPGCKSIIVVGVNYQMVDSDSSTILKTNGRIASFALNQDYHVKLNHKMMAFRDSMIRLLKFQFNSKLFVDSFPILEKSLGQQAGLGWIGKNSLLVSPLAGSTFNLGEILLDLDLNFSTPFEHDLCADCHLCIDACPTKCINPDRTLKASECISYLTIEHKGSIPRQLRNKMGTWIFGCDICQLVCPFNKNSISLNRKQVDNKQYGFVDLIKEIKDTQVDFEKKYFESSIRRIGFNTFQRNLIIAMGNICDPRFEITLRDFLLNNADPVLRLTSAWALGKVSSKLSRKILDGAVQNEMHADVRQEIFLALDGNDC